MQETSLYNTVRHAFGRVVYTHKTHEKMADQLESWLRFVKWTELMLIVLTTGSTISVVFGSGKLFEIISSILASLTLLVTVYQFRFAPDDRIRLHRTTASKLWYIRERYIALLSDITDGSIPDKQARTVRDELINSTNDIYENAPATNSRAYEAARKALQLSEEMSFSDEEIDDFLPPTLSTQTPKS